MFSIKKIVLSGLLLVAAAGMTACSNQEVKPASHAVADAVSEVYEVYHDGRINVFYDRKTYEEFMALGETTFRLTRIGAGPNGETIVFGLTKHDKKKGGDAPVVKLYDKKTEAASNFYGEARRHGRIYVFNSFKDMEPVRQFGHPNFFYMQVGAGPKGETVVYVLNKHNKKHKPVELMEAFKRKTS